MLGFHPFSTQAFSSAIPFVDALTTTNALTAAVGSAIANPIAVTYGTNLGMTTTVPDAAPALTLIGLPSGNALAAAINNVAVFTWAQVDDTTSETWSQVSDSTSQSWTQVDDTTDQEWRDA
jgi:hypothetical protein